MSAFLDNPDVTETERTVIRRLRTESGWWNGDATALRIMRDYATAILGEERRRCALVCERNLARAPARP